MRKELELIQLIERYLNNTLSAEDRTLFEEKMQKSESLREEVEKQRLVMEAAQNIGTRQTIKKAKKTFTIKQATWYGMLAVVGAGIIAASIYGYQKYYSGGPHENIKYALNENGTTLWSEADEMIAPQFFTINSEEDQVLETDQGMLLAIPAGAFLDANGNSVTGDIEIEVKEALDAASILLAGLNTKSGEDLLETGGMFYVNARKDGESLKINPNNPIVAEVPTDEVLPGMELYHGVRTDDGGLDWQNPKPIEKFLTPVDITSLDFYPPKYEPQLAEMGYGSETKAWKDSVYYSFGNSKVMLSREYLNPELSADSLLYEEESIKYKELNPSKVQAIWNDQFQNTLLATQEFEERMHLLHCLGKDQFLDFYVNNLDLKMATIDSMVLKKIGSSEGMLPQSSTKHVTFNYSFSTTTGNTGIFISGVLEKGWKFYTEKNIDNGPMGANFTLDSKSGCISNDINLFSQGFKSSLDEEWGEETYYFDDVISIFVPLQFHCDDISLSGCLNYMLCNDEECIIDKFCIDFSPFKSELWFDSLLERACEPCLSCDLEAISKKYQELALQNCGRMKMELGASRALKAYYEKHAKIYAEAAAKVQKDFLFDYEQATLKLGKDEAKKQMEDWARNSQNLKDEIELNLNEAYKQLGITKPKISVKDRKQKYTTPITSTGWNNIDRKVIEGTVARETINVEYEGKTAEIKYEPIAVSVVDKDTYDRVFVYLLPHELNSFQRITNVDGTGVYSEKLNEFIEYDLVVIGYKGDKIYVGKQQDVNSRDYAIKLWVTDKGDLKAVMHSMGKSKQRPEFVQDILDQQSLLLQQTDVQKMEDMLVFRTQLDQAIFQCFREEMVSVEVVPFDTTHVVQ